MTRITSLGRAAVVSFLVCAGVCHAAPIDGSFSYQGRLTDAGAPVTGLADVRFSLWDSPAAGSQIGSTLTFNNVAVMDGLFTQDLDFGVDALNGEERWLEIEARTPAGAGSFVTLSPRQKITGAPYAIQTRGIFVNDNLDVGIGTTSPIADLHLGGNAPGLLVQDDTTNVGVNLTSDFNGFIWSPLTITTDLAGSAGLRVDQDDEVAQSVYFNTLTGLRTVQAGTASNSRSGFMTLAGIGGTDTIRLWGDGDFDPSDGIDRGRLMLRSFNGGEGGELSILNDSGSEIFEILGGEGSTPGSLTLFDYITGSTIARFYRDNFLQGRFETFDRLSGGMLVSLGTDSSGAGGELRLAVDDDGTLGIDLSGNSGNPSLQLNGESRAIRLNTGLSGSNSVLLPSDAIHDTEILDEPGVASTGSDSIVNLSSTVDTVIALRTLDVPSSGYCFVVATCQSSLTHTNGTTTSAEYGINELGSSPDSNQDAAHQISNAAPTGTYRAPVTVSGLFPVTSGINSFVFYGRSLSGAAGSAQTADRQLSIIFLPTAYGTVSRIAAAPPGQDPESLGIVEPPLTAADIQLEQLEAVEFDRARRAREYAEMQAIMRDLQIRMDAFEREMEPRRATPQDAEATGSISGASP